MLFSGVATNFSSTFLGSKTVYILSSDLVISCDTAFIGNYAFLEKTKKAPII